METGNLASGTSMPDAARVFSNTAMVSCSSSIQPTVVTLPRRATAANLPRYIWSYDDKTSAVEGMRYSMNEWAVPVRGSVPLKPIERGVENSLNVQPVRSVNP